MKLPFVTASPDSGTFNRTPAPFGSGSLASLPSTFLSTSSLDDIKAAASETCRARVSCSMLAAGVSSSSLRSPANSNAGRSPSISSSPSAADRGRSGGSSIFSQSSPKYGEITTTVPIRSRWNVADEKKLTVAAEVNAATSGGTVDSIESSSAIASKTA